MQYNWLLWIVGVAGVNFFLVKPINNYLLNKTHGNKLIKWFFLPTVHFLLGGLCVGVYIWVFVQCK